jgi:putative ubiquitin-RnfH superfamily antitoxin RatB of RatAB toxin-antitoxin module
MPCHDGRTMTAKPERGAETEPGDTITVTVCFSPGPRQVRERHLTLPAGSTVAQALAAFLTLKMESAASSSPDVDLACDSVSAGVWGRKASADQPLRDQDRVEIYRALKVDPKVARRERFVKQGVKKAGLFARRRVGAKPGY